MSLSTEENVQKFTASEGQTVYDFGIYYFDDTDLSVSIVDGDGGVTNLTLGTGAGTFAIQATNGDRRQGATITTNDPATEGDLITISRTVPATQEYDLKAGAEINPTALNKAFDRVVAQIQQLDGDGVRHITHPVTDPADTNYSAGSTDTRSNKVLGYDSFGNVITLTPLEIGSVAVNNAGGLEILNTSTEADEVTLEINVNGKYAVKDLGVDTAQVADGAITPDKLSTGVILESLPNGAVIPDALSGDDFATYFSASLTGDGILTIFPLGFTCPTLNAIAYTVAIDGILQEPNATYGMGSTVIAFITPPPNGAKIIVTCAYIGNLSL